MKPLCDRAPVIGERQVEDVRADGEGTSLACRGVQLCGVSLRTHAVQVPGGAQDLVGDVEAAHDGADFDVGDQPHQLFGAGQLTGLGRSESLLQH